ncbi:hypothetical protein F4561_005740 [Lipingzhangella halophila]|uniref:Uncharacterized protein n=1 Tax=Lipingzhangella halophila TaxID=1783352 RepID=A0A7W7W5J5_9ACTN|nr:hypothetical protein [Lipingzhangella halophila]MBB4934846.1 hypothetical protein [Lipingzhangella halophila]
MWLLLAQAQYEGAEYPESTGCPFWMIRRQGLAEMNFENVELVMQFYR